MVMEPDDYIYEADERDDRTRVRRTTTNMTRSAKHILIKFTLGAGMKEESFRLRVGGEIERQHRNVDELGEVTTSWVKMSGDPKGLPTKAKLMELALTTTFSDLLNDRTRYPDGITCVNAVGEMFVPGERGGQVIVINLGSVTP